MKIYVLLQCFYDGDDNFIDDSFCGASCDVEELVSRAREIDPNAEVFLQDQTVPHNGSTRKRFRIIETGLIMNGSPAREVEMVRGYRNGAKYCQCPECFSFDIFPEDELCDACGIRFSKT